MKKFLTSFIFLVAAVVAFGQTPINYKEGDFTGKQLKTKSIKLDNNWLIDKSSAGTVSWKYNNTAVSTMTSAGAVSVVGLTTTGNITLANGETISNSTDGVTNLGNSNIRGATWNFASAAAVGGTAASAIAIDFTPDLPALQAGLMVMFVAEGANTTTLTLAIDGGTAKNIFEQEPGVAPNALDGNEIQTGTLVMAVYDGTQWVLVSPTGNH